MMKQMYLLLAAMWLLTAGASAQKTCAILDQEQGMIEFEVDTDLPAPESKIRFQEEKWLVNGVLNEFQIPSDQQNVLAHSFKDAKLINRGRDVMYQTFIFAFADHRPLVLSPDMIWLLISQTFGRYVNENAEAMRPLLVEHDGKMDLVVQSKQDILHDKDYQWDELFNQFSTEIAKHTKGNVAETVTANFSTTGITERIASQITLMEAMKRYFTYVELYFSCGIPYIILKGTPADWREVEKKTAALDAYDMGGWTRELKPLLRQFTRAAEGKPDAKFWKNIVMEDRPDRLRGGGCSNEKPTEFDGWFLKFFPDTKTRTIPKSMKRGGSMASEMCRVSFKHVNINDVTGEIVETCDVELFAGFIGIEVDEKTGALTPHIGWLARRSDVAGEVAERFSKNSESFRISEVPEALKRLSHIKELHLNFSNKSKVVIPEWFDNIEVDDLEITGTMTEHEAELLRKRFPSAKVNRPDYDKTLKQTLPTTYRLDSIFDRSGNNEIFESYAYDEQGRIAEIYSEERNNPYRKYLSKKKYVLRYDHRGFNTEVLTYSLDSAVPAIVCRSLATYDDEGHLLTQQNYSYIEGQMYLSEDEVNEYDVKGRLVISTERSYPEPDDRDPILFCNSHTYFYDRKGRVIEIRDSIQQRDGHYTPTYFYKYKYDKRGNRILEENKNMQESLYHDFRRIRYKRTYMDGLEVKREEWNETSGSRTDSHAVVHLSYDMQGNLLQTQREDATYYYGRTSYYYDFTTPASRVVGYDAVRHRGMDMLPSQLLRQVPNVNYRLMLKENTISEPLLGGKRGGTCYYYSAME